MPPQSLVAGHASSPLDDASLAELLAAAAVASTFVIEPSSRTGALIYLRVLVDAAARIEGLAGIDDVEPAETFVP